MDDWTEELRGWTEGGNGPIETYWMGDPAIDLEASDVDRYRESMAMDALVVRKGAKPLKLEVTLPGDAPTRMLLQEVAARAASEREQGEEPDRKFAMLIAEAAFRMCVRFPDLETIADGADKRPGPAKRVRGPHGKLELPDRFMGMLASNPKWTPMLITIGSWIWTRTFLTVAEKKTSSQVSTEKT